jgi:site-specific DNA-methyltransferase (adenine-specific)
MSGFPDNAVDFILTDPPYLVGFRDRQGRTIAGDKTDEWLQPACHEMYRVLKKDALMVSFYGWNRVDRFMAAWKQAGFSVVGHLVFPKTYTSKAAYVGYRHECAYILAKGRPPLPQNPLNDVIAWKYSGNRHHPTEKPVASLQPLIESFTHPGAIVLDPFAGSGSTCVLPSRLAVVTSVLNCLSSITGPDSSVWPPSGAPCSTRPLTTSSRRPRNELCRTRKTPRRSGGSRQQHV